MKPRIEYGYRAQLCSRGMEQQGSKYGNEKIKECPKDG
jgi:hypothetical protein